MPKINDPFATHHTSPHALDDTLDPGIGLAPSQGPAAATRSDVLEDGVEALAFTQPAAGAPDRSPFVESEYAYTGPLSAFIQKTTGQDVLTVPPHLRELLNVAIAALLEEAAKKLGSGHWLLEYTQPTAQGGQAGVSVEVQVYPPPPPGWRVMADLLAPDRGTEASIAEMEAEIGRRNANRPGNNEITPWDIGLVVSDKRVMDTYSEANELALICDHLHANLDRLGPEARAMLEVLDKFRAIAEARPGGYLLEAEKFVLMVLLGQVAPSWLNKPA